MPVNSRAKGIRGELEASKLLTSYGFEARRAQQYQGTSDSSDLIVPRFEQLRLFPEIKRCEQLRLWPWMKKCEEDIAQLSLNLAAKHFHQHKPAPVIIHKRSNEDWMVTMTAKGFLELINRLESKRG